MFISDLQYEVHASNVTKSHEAESTGTLSPFVLQDHNVINRPEFYEICFELRQIQIMWKSTHENFSKL